MICSPGKDYVLIILFQLYVSKAGLFENNLFWVGHCMSESRKVVGEYEK